MLCSRLGIPAEVERKANSLFLRSSGDEIICDENTEAVAAASVYVACRKRGHPIRFRDIGSHSRVHSRRLIGRCYRLITERCCGGDSVSPESDDFAAMFCEALGVSPASRRLAVSIASQVLTLNLVPEENNQAIAAAAVFISLKDTDEAKSARFISRICQLRTGPILRVHKRLVPHIQQLLTPQIPLI
jgi:transcription initiation factor TFIIB